MKIIVVYATYSGGTLLTAELIGSVLASHTHEVVIQNVTDTKPEHLQIYDLVIFGSNTWLENGKDGQLHSEFSKFVLQLKGKLFTNSYFAVFALGDSNYLHFAYSANHLEALVTELKGQQIVPAMRVNRFYFNQEKNEEIIKQWAEGVAEKLQSLPKIVK